MSATANRPEEICVGLLDVPAQTVAALLNAPHRREAYELAWEFVRAFGRISHMDAQSVVARLKRSTGTVRDALTGDRSFLTPERVEDSAFWAKQSAMRTLQQQALDLQTELDTTRARIDLLDRMMSGEDLNE